MITIRFHGSTTSVQHLDAARHQRGILDLHVLRAEERAHGLDQHQADAPGREQRFERPAVEPADHRALEHHADQPRNHEGGRDGAQQVPVESAGQ